MDSQDSFVDLLDHLDNILAGRFNSDPAVNCRNGRLVVTELRTRMVGRKTEEFPKLKKEDE